MHQATDKLTTEPILDTTTTVRTREEKPGDLGRHEVRGLRGYQVRRVVGEQARQQFAFSTLSPFVLGRLGAANVGQP